MFGYLVGGFVIFIAMVLIIRWVFQIEKIVGNLEKIEKHLSDMNQQPQETEPQANVS